MSRKIVSMKGGLGNQLFQIAFVDFLCQQLEERVIIDVSWYFSRHKDASRELSALSLINQYKSKSFSRFFHFYLRKFRSGTIFIDNEKVDYLNPGIVKFRYFDGFFQSKLLAPRVFPILDEKYRRCLEGPSEDRVAVHVRRGDYLNKNTSDHHGLCEIEYFERAVEHFLTIDSKLEVDVFSDDQEFAIEAQKRGWNFKLTQTSPLEDIFLMSHYNYIVISNSTFSWWATQFSRDMKRSQKVIAPYPWLKSPGRHESNLYQEDWLILTKTTDDAGNIKTVDYFGI